MAAALASTLRRADGTFGLTTAASLSKSGGSGTGAKCGLAVAERRRRVASMPLEATFDLKRTVWSRDAVLVTALVLVAALFIIDTGSFDESASATSLFDMRPAG